MDLQINAEFARKLKECLFADERYIIVYGGRGGLTVTAMCWNSAGHGGVVVPAAVRALLR